ncbi:tetratricopeptide repeat protein [Luteolibacter yonseiensis]|uniref:Tetratricopeptide repeat protein n=2 Tax=Luteolibacter yonseiensis TaxID=1144680 RepID=A0A934R492_9BACT|nr:tetratricopeptide repeat protein [Luteolibacter yonseiensis]MBK1815758.1 tetratricopeptide repeat protein [Luteolibacter yonseiensis]
MAYKDSIAYYRPLKNLTFGLIASASDPAKPETVQAALTAARTFGFLYSIVAAFGIFALVQRVSRDEWLALTCAGFWLLSAAGTSSAVWVSAQNIAMAVAFGCFAFVYADKFLMAETTGRKIRYGVGGVLLFAAGLLCYDSIVALPGMFAAYLALRWLQKDLSSEAANKGAAMLGLWVSVVVGWLFLRHHTGAISDGAGHSVLFSPDTSRMQVFSASAWFFWRHSLMWFWPFGTLEIGGSYIPGKSVSTASLIWGWVFLAAYLVSIPALAWIGIRKSCKLSGLIALGLAMGIIGAFPSGNFVPLYAGPLGDYYTLVPSIGWSLALAAGSFLLGRKTLELLEPDSRKVFPILAAAGLLIIAVNRIAGVFTMSLVSARSQQPVDMALASIAVRPLMVMNQINLADGLVAQDKPGQALPIFEDALQTAPWISRVGYAQALSRMERYEEAVTQYDIALEKEKETERLLTANYGKAVALRKLGRRQEAVQVIQRVIHNTTYRHHLQMVAFGIVVAQEADDDETARRWLAKARDIYPDNPLIDQAAAAANLR